jgi:hypothetical protein
MSAHPYPHDRDWLFGLDGEPVRYGATDDALDTRNGRNAREPAAGGLAHVAGHVR